MPFKYKEHIAKFNNTECPPSDYEEKDLICYRWVYGDMDNEDNFIPQYLKKPARYIKKEDSQKCEAIALSFFNKEKNAKARFEFLKQHSFNGSDKIYEALGSSIAKGKISRTDGVNGKIAKNDHFNHHPYKQENYNSRFKIVSKL